MGNKCTRFYNACERGDISTIDVLIKSIDINFIFNESCKNGKLNVLKHIHKSIVHHTHALYDTLYNGHLECAKFIYDCDPVQIHSKTLEGYTPFHVCCMQTNRIDCAEFIMEHDPSQLSIKTLEGLTPLLLACLHNNFDMVKYIISHDQTQIFIRSMHGDTPLLICCSGNNLELIKFVWELNPEQ